MLASTSVQYLLLNCRHNETVKLEVNQNISIKPVHYIGYFVASPVIKRSQHYAIALYRVNYFDSFESSKFKIHRDSLFWYIIYYIASYIAPVL